MAKKTLVRNQDQFLVRLPDGMRERIKAKADRAGMSMNEAIVWVLEKHFPAPATLEDKISSLVEMVAALKSGNELEDQVDTLVDEIDETLRRVSTGKIKASDSFRERVSFRVHEWDMEEVDRSANDPLSDESWHAEANWEPFDDVPPETR